MSHQVSTGARRFVVASALFLLVGQWAILADAPRRVVVTLVLYGFVFHMLFGKGYALIPAYFDRTLAVAWAPSVHLPLSVLGVVGLVGATQNVVYAQRVGALAWCAGVTVFVGTIGWTIRDNLLGGDTGTGEANADRAAVDRIANLFVPVALVYLVLGSADLLALAVGGPTLVADTTAQVSHLLGAGTASLLLFAIGFRLFPRFLVAHPPTALVVVVLPAGAVGPVLVAVGLYSHLLVVGLVLEAIAVVGFAVAFAVLFARSPRQRVGFYGVLCGMGAGVLGVLLATLLALDGYTSAVVTAHYRTMLVGFLGLSIVGAAYQFYPPAVGTLPGTTDSTALASIALLAVGLAGQVGGLLGGIEAITVGGEASALGGAGLYVYIIGAAFKTRY
jgi:hypothetical protein